MFATVCGQLAQYLERRRLQADESRRVEAMLRAERDRAQRYLDVAGTMIVVLDAEGASCSSTARAARCSAGEESELLGARLVRARRARTTSAMRRAPPSRASCAARRGASSHNESAIVQPGGGTRLVAWHSVILRDDDGSRSGTLVLRRGRDGAPPGRAADHLPRLPRPAHGPANRACSRSTSSSRWRARAARVGVALLHLELDGFKLVNDSLGHAAGDELLCRLAVRLQGSSARRDLLARTGGDEFLLLLADLQDDPVTPPSASAGQVVAVARRAVHGRRRRVPGVRPRSASRSSPRDAARRRDAARPRRRRDVPREAARPRRLGRLRAGRRATRSSASRWRRACAARSSASEFALHYQPIFAADRARWCGVEALLRWHDPERAAWSRRASSSPWPRRPG